ncbi:hypothetical protein AAO05_22060, partial [Salmonella enterica subsp. enterica serovar Infantis]|nr:hypothetical protein [Salmonella enterica subsp. enterica serovar Infantis]EEJ5736364.1 hypothetical protein [Salmonella enterica]
MVQNRGIFRRNTRSRKTRNSVHVPPEWMFTLGQNTQLCRYGVNVPMISAIRQQWHLFAVPAD